MSKCQNDTECNNNYGEVYQSYTNKLKNKNKKPMKFVLEHMSMADHVIIKNAWLAYKRELCS